MCIYYIIHIYVIGQESYVRVGISEDSCIYARQRRPDVISEVGTTYFIHIYIYIYIMLVIHKYFIISYFILHRAL